MNQIICYIASLRMTVFPLIGSSKRSLISRLMSMKGFVAILLIQICFINAEAQQFPLFSHYLEHPLAINPAFTGTYNYTPVRFTSRQQWIGIEGAPTTQVFSFHGRIGEADFYNRKGMLNNENTFDKEGYIIRDKGMILSGRDAVGALIYNDRNGPINRSGIQLMYSRHQILSAIRDRFYRSPSIAFAVGTILSQFVLDESKLKLYDPDDPIIQGGKESIFIPDVAFGMVLYTDEYYAGLSVQNLFQPRIRINDRKSKDNRLMRHYFLFAGYHYEMNDGMELEPYVLIKSSEYAPMQVDIGARLLVKVISAGLIYRSNNEFSIMLGLKTGRYYLGYSFDYAFTGITQYSNGSHEIVLGYNIGESLYRGYRFNK
jgi:type IX secretion system PorP/SprF family membrane protein